MTDQKRILIAPLNWGLGHSSRCIPIIRTLLEQNHQVLVASDGRALQLLRAEFPTLLYYQLPSYAISYRSANMIWNIGWQLPKVIRAVILEKRAINKLAQQAQIDIIISDNRFGAFAKTTHNIFLTHQLHLKTPFRALAIFVNWWNHFFIQRFDECWIPDFAEAEKSLANTLSHPILANIPTHYLGTLSRLTQIEKKPHWDIFVLLSGPEPQRTFLEEKIIRQLKNIPLKVIVVQGKTEKREEFQFTENIKIVSFMKGEEVSETAADSHLMICRSGYSTIMDLYHLQKKAILIPTPGQTEQEYLAETLEKKGIFYTQTQQNFDLETALKEVGDYSGFLRGEVIDLGKKLSNLL